MTDEHLARHPSEGGLLAVQGAGGGVREATFGLAKS